MNDFKNKNIIVTGGSRGIGLAIAKKLASEGANIAILAKTDRPLQLEKFKNLEQRPWQLRQISDLTSKLKML